MIARQDSGGGLPQRRRVGDNLYKQTMDAALDQFDKLNRAPEPMAQYCADIAAYFAG